MDQFRDIIQRACQEGLVPFILASTNGTPAKRNTVRILEIAIPIILLILTISYYGGKLVSTVERLDKGQAERQEVDKGMLKTLHKMDKIQGQQGILLNQAIGDIKNHKKFNHKVLINGK